jgi:hypothetical protein
MDDRYKGSFWTLAGESEQLRRDRYAKVQKLASESIGLNCLATPDGQPHYSAMGTRVYGVDAATDDLIDKPHGRLVYDELVHLLEDRDWTRGGCTRHGFDLLPDDLADQIWLRDLELWQKDGQNLILAAIDTDGITTEAIARRIEQMVDLLADPVRSFILRKSLGVPETDPPVRGFVLNMSFVLLPCDPTFGTLLRGRDLLDYYQQALNPAAFKAFSLTPEAAEPEAVAPVAVPSLEQDLVQVLGQLDTQPGWALLEQPQFGQLQLALAYTGIELDEIREKTLFNKSDPLYMLLDGYRSDPPAGVPVISVGAAGNSGIEFPFAPALWKGVTSISSLDAKYSNHGEVAMPGEHPSQKGEDSGKPIHGTSFAAPRFSLRAAQYLLDGRPGPCDDWPPFSYVDVPIPDDPQDSQLNYLVSLDWKNLPLDEGAAKEHCRDFPVVP